MIVAPGEELRMGLHRMARTSASTTRPRVVVAGTLPAAGLDLLRERFTVEVGGSRPDAGWLRAQAPGATAIVADPSIPVDGELLDAVGDSLKVVSNFGVGYDNIDVDATRARGVRVTNTPDVLTNATAELTVALMLAAARRIAEGDAIVRDERWSGWGPEEFLGHELTGATVGLVGFGRIAQRVAELLGGFKVRLLFASRSSDRGRFGAERRELGDLLGASEFVSLHVPLTPETRHLIDARALSRIRRGAILVNTSRGAVVDETALIKALRTGRLAAAGLDVYEDEPHVPTALRDLPNTVLLPHVGSATGPTRDAMARLCAENVIAAVEGREPPAAVA
jgi:glyoxylate reductase